MYKFDWFFGEDCFVLDWMFDYVDNMDWMLFGVLFHIGLVYIVYKENGCYEY